MKDSFLPWWCVLLLVMWSAAVTVWIHPKVHREMRIWGGLLTLVYCGLIFMAMGGMPVAGAGKVTSSSSIGLHGVCLFILIAVSLMAGVCSIGRLSARCRTLCHVLLTISNAGICFLLQQPEVAMGLLVVAGVKGWPLVRRWMRQRPEEWPDVLAEFTQFISGTPDNLGEFSLIGSLTALVALVLVGTISFSTRFEHPQSAMIPSQNGFSAAEQNDRILGKPSTPGSKNAIDEAFGRRADVVVLMTVIVFLGMAMLMTEPATGPLMASTISSSSKLKENDLEQ